MSKIKSMRVKPTKDGKSSVTVRNDVTKVRQSEIKQTEAESHEYADKVINEMSPWEAYKRRHGNI